MQDHNFSGARKGNRQVDSKASPPLTETSFYILLSLKDGQRHGYEMIQWVRKFTNGEVELQGGTVYNCLLRMEREGLVRLTLEENRRKYYALTKQGETVLRAECLRLERMYENSKNLPWKGNR